MKTSMLKWPMFAIMFVTNFVAFASGPEIVDGEGDTTDGTDPDVSINAKLLILLAFGLVFVYAYFKNHSRKIEA